MPEDGRADRGRIRQALLRGGLADRGHVVLEPRGRGELQDVQRLVRPDQEDVREPWPEPGYTTWLSGQMRRALLPADGRA